MNNISSENQAVETLLNKGSLFLIAGPCVVENKEIVFQIAEEVLRICTKYNMPYIFKASYRKANRSSIDSFTGIGDVKALEIIAAVREKFNIPVLTDVHSVSEVEIAKSYVDILQIPAFLCRQTDLLVAAAKTEKTVVIKKGQFMSPESMKFAIEKVRASGNEKVGLIERGTSFGYGDLVVDFRGIPIMQKFEVPVVMDCTHSLQRPNQNTGVTGGYPEHIETIAKAAVAAGVDGLFIETHPSPDKAKSDGANMLKLSKLDELIGKLLKIKSALN
jgi:2-dehydro-3-deoxyphosphooctonate aldolase (KDO 8-P synthase)